MKETIRGKKKHPFVIAIFVVLGAAAFFVGSTIWAVLDSVEIPFKLDAVYLTWNGDPQTTMSVFWIDANSESSGVEISGDGTNQWAFVNCESRPIAGIDRFVHQADFMELRPGNKYHIRWKTTSEVFHFKTLDSDPAKPLRFVVGGDVYRDEGIIRDLCSHAMAFSPDFIIVGGDIAYANGDERNVGNWMNLFAIWKDSLVNESGLLTPIIPVIGNHEVNKNDGLSPDNAPYYYTFFPAFNGRGYGVLDVRPDLSLFILDTDHTNPIIGTQTQWLEEALASRHDVMHKFAAYHIPAYPSVRPYDVRESREIRENWAPLFEQHGVKMCFEHHDHAYKRSRRIRESEVSDDGIIYVGDGAWGTHTRKVHSKRWYIEKASDVNHLIFVTVDKNSRSVHALAPDGTLVDSFVDTK